MRDRFGEASELHERAAVGGVRRRHVGRAVDRRLQAPAAPLPPAATAAASASRRTAAQDQRCGRRPSAIHSNSLRAASQSARSNATWPASRCSRGSFGANVSAAFSSGDRLQMTPLIPVSSARSSCSSSDGFIAVSLASAPDASSAYARVFQYSDSVSSCFATAAIAFRYRFARNSHSALFPLSRLPLEASRARGLRRWQPRRTPAQADALSRSAARAHSACPVFV